MSASFQAECERIFRDWDAAARAADVEAMLALYAEDAVFETALVPVVWPEKSSGVLRGKPELRRFFAMSSATRPEAALRWYRTGRWLSDGERLLAWEYPRVTPDGEQVDVAEFFEIEHGLIAAHRVYWGWKSAGMLAPALARREEQASQYFAPSDHSGERPDVDHTNNAEQPNPRERPGRST
jgi:ketosteroid isomerase-like protein